MDTVLRLGIFYLDLDQNEVKCFLTVSKSVVNLRRRDHILLRRTIFKVLDISSKFLFDTRTVALRRRSASPTSCSSAYQSYRSAATTYAGSGCRRSDVCVSSCRNLRPANGKKAMPRLTAGVNSSSSSCSRVGKQTCRKPDNSIMKPAKKTIISVKSMACVDGTAIAEREARRP